ncbi:NAD-binding protein [Methylobacillus flagellatus]|uniref:potassium channel family protein n=1 Tax=Methylobacillus flagellatus TaxID=405 RepID=UPI0010F767E4
MNSILFLILRRMRAPIITVIITYTVAVIGMTLMPGHDPDGNHWQMSLFEAFYVISYTATTIGFGEVPFPYSPQQRLWMTFSIYFTVIPWFYAIGKIISLAQDPSLKQAFITSSFSRGVQQLQEPFYIVCGYGETGSLLVGALDKKGMRVVVVEMLQERINELELEDHQSAIPNLCADAKMPDTLLKAGVRHPMCGGVAALTDDDHANLAIAVAVKLMNPDLPVLARAENDETAANMLSFGTDHIINPYTLFGDHLAMEVHALGSYLLHEWLTGVPGDSLPSPACPPIGKWLVCGYGRFGKSVVENLQREGMSTMIIEADPELTGCDECIVGSGAEAHTLHEAGVTDAVGIVAGTDNDINNLSIVMTAREINPNLFVVIRKNKRFNEPLFQHFNADITMDPSDIIAHECLAHMISPLLAQFLLLARAQNNQWANQLISQLVEIVGESVPETWAATLSITEAPGVLSLLDDHVEVRLAHLLRDPSNRERAMGMVPLLLVRGNEQILLPANDTLLQAHDRLLFCGQASAKASLPLLLCNRKSLSYIIDGKEIADGWVWRWMRQHLPN